MLWYILCLLATLVDANQTLSVPPTTDVQLLDAPPVPLQERRPTGIAEPKKELQTSGSAPIPYGYPALSGGYEHSGSQYEPVGSHFAGVYHQQDAGHALDDHNKRYSSNELAMAFLAYMGVLSVLQGALIALTRGNTVLGILPARRRRDAAKSSASKMTRVATIDPQSVTPSTTQQTWVAVADSDVRCIQHSVCDINRKLTIELGTAGKILGKHVSQWAARSVGGWGRLVTDAGHAGQAGEDCAVLYRGCPAADEQDAETSTN